MHHIGYKKCKDDRIVKLCIEGLNNECRKGIVDAQHAKYRCSQATVLNITSWDEQETFDMAESMGIGDTIPIVYKVGEIITINDYDTDLDVVCSSGIHYFLDRQTAVYFWGAPKGYTGLCKRYYDDGQLSIKCECRDGKLHGLYEGYLKNGQLVQKCEYRDGERNGLYEEYNEKGILIVKVVVQKKKEYSW